jgi:hypothetical protein
MSCYIRKTRMMAGSQCDARTDPNASKELQGNMARMMAERDRQDAMWSQPVEAKPEIPKTMPLYTQQKTELPKTMPLYSVKSSVSPFPPAR